MTASRTVEAKAERHIRAHLPLSPVPGLGGLDLHHPTPTSGLGALPRRFGLPDSPPYWAYAWAGGLALAHHLRANPGLVAGNAVLDLGAGSGLVGIVAAQLGAAHVLAADTDPLARAAIRLNAAANKVAITVTAQDFLQEPCPALDRPGTLILAGDLFYDDSLAARALAMLSAAVEGGHTVLVGDPGRKTLPRDRFEEVARYKVGDMGHSATAPPVTGLVLRLRRLSP